MKTDKQNDARLVEAYQSGNKEALAILVKRWHLLFCKKAFWIVKDADLSKDIAQETWHIIIQKINKLNDTSSFGSWALRIVYSKSLDKLRAVNRERERKNIYEKEQLNSVEDIEDNEPIKRLLKKTMKELPEQQQIVLKLFYVEDYSLKEISEILNIAGGTVKSRLFHAREKLKKQLKSRNYEK